MSTMASWARRVRSMTSSPTRFMRLSRSVTSTRIVCPSDAAEAALAVEAVLPPGAAPAQRSPPPASPCPRPQAKPPELAQTPQPVRGLAASAPLPRRRPASRRLHRPPRRPWPLKPIRSQVSRGAPVRAILSARGSLRPWLLKAERRADTPHFRGARLDGLAGGFAPQHLAVVLEHQKHLVGADRRHQGGRRDLHFRRRRGRPPRATDLRGHPAGVSRLPIRPVDRLPPGLLPLPAGESQPAPPPLRRWPLAPPSSLAAPARSRRRCGTCADLLFQGRVSGVTSMFSAWPTWAISARQRRSRSTPSKSGSAISDDISRSPWRT